MNYQTRPPSEKILGYQGKLTWLSVPKMAVHVPIEILILKMIVKRRRINKFTFHWTAHKHGFQQQNKQKMQRTHLGIHRRRDLARR